MILIVLTKFNPETFGRLIRNKGIEERIFLQNDYQQFSSNYCGFILSFTAFFCILNIVFQLIWYSAFFNV